MKKTRLRVNRDEASYYQDSRKYNLRFIRKVNKQLYNEIFNQSNDFHNGREKNIRKAQLQEIVLDMLIRKDETKIRGQESFVERFEKLNLDNKKLKAELVEIKESKSYKVACAIACVYRKTQKHVLKIYYVISKLRFFMLNRYRWIKDKLFFKMHKRFIYEINRTDNPKMVYEKYISIPKKNRFYFGRFAIEKLKKSGELTYRLKILNDMVELRPNTRFILREIDIVNDKLEMLNNPHYDKSLVSENMYIQYGVKEDSIKSLNVVNTSLPYRTNGYGIRCNYIFNGQKRWGIEPIVCTRPGFPNDYKDGTLEAFRLKNEIYNNIKYYRNNTNVFQRYTPLSRYIDTYAREIVRVGEKEEIDVVHAASNYVIGLSGMMAAETLKKPFIYEVRGLWHETKLVNSPEYKNSEEYKLSEKMEVFVAKKANRLITISEALKSWMVTRGVDPDKIIVVPNGVDSKKIYPVEKKVDLKKKYLNEEDFVIGYIGSITKLEGLNKIIKSIEILEQEGIKNIKFLVAGTGKYLEELKKIADASKVRRNIVFVGKINHNMVNDFYSIFDICVFPREDEEVCRIVPPLKILEAMACSKAIITSDLEVLRETVVDGLNGIIFSNTIEDLCKKIKDMYFDMNNRIEIGRNAREWIKKNREWSKLTYTIIKAYKEII